MSLTAPSTVNRQGLQQGFAYGLPWIEACCGVLKDSLESALALFFVCPTPLILGYAIQMY